MKHAVMVSWVRVLVPFCVALIASLGVGQEMEEKFEVWPTNLGIRGMLGVAREPSVLQPLCERLDPQDLGSSMILYNSEDQQQRSNAFQRLKEARFENINTFADWNKSSDSVFWVDNRSPEEISAETKEQFAIYASEVLSRGGSVFLCGPHAEIVGHSYLNAQADAPGQIQKGLNLLPDCLLQLEFPETEEAKAILLAAVGDLPRCVGVGLGTETCLLLRNRQVRVFGKGEGTFLLAAGTYPSPRSHSIKDMTPRVREFDKVFVDLTQWRREAIDRTLPPFPSTEIVAPEVSHGSLLIVGGGGLPSRLMDRFVELAGGVENAKLVYVPCEESEEVGEVQSTVNLWRSMGVKQATFIHTKDRIRANEDETFLQPLVEATGIWFGGGRQWNLADSYYGTKAHRLMKQCVERGGVIGGSSAGASIQANYLARATPIENFKIMAPGYERGGLGFLRGVAIDQHFSQRNRLPDLIQLVTTYPQLLGIGIDETTAIEVSGSVAQVLGKGSVYFVDGTNLQTDGSPVFSKLQRSERYDLVKRKQIAP